MNRIALLLLCALLGGGCASMTPGKMAWVQTTSNQPRAGNVYLLRGWIGIFSYGINQIGEKLNAAGVRASVYQENQWSDLADEIILRYRQAKDPEPLVLVGHSFGADDTLRVSKALEAAGISVDLIVTLDPVTPPEVPSNVKRVCNLYQSHGAWDKLPLFRGVPLKVADLARTRMQNLDIRKDRTDLLEPGTDHFNIEKKAKIHAEVLRQVLLTCPGRSEWTTARSKPPEAGFATQKPTTHPAHSDRPVARTDSSLQ